MARWIRARRTLTPLAVVGLLVGVASSPAFAGTGAGAPSQRGVQPTVEDVSNSNPLNECRTLTGLTDVHAFKIAGEGGGFPGGSPYDNGTLTVTISDWDPGDKTFDWATNIPVLGVWVKGGSGGQGNWYDYSGFADQPPADGADHDGELHPKDNPNGVAGLSHVTFCYGEAITPPGTPDIVVQKDSDASGPVDGGDTITYTIEVSNVGDATAHDVTVSDTLPAGVHPVGGAPTLDGADGFCAAAGSVGPDGTESYSLHCEIEEIAAGASATVTASVEVDEDAPCGALTNVVHAEADDEPGGAVDDGNDDQVTDEVACECGVAIAKSVDPLSGNPGDEVTYTYEVVNVGQETIDVTVTDDVLGAVGTATLAPGEDAVFHETFVLPAEGSSVVNVGTVNAETEGGDTCVDRDDATVAIVSAGGGNNPPDGDGENPPGGGTAFTGPADLPAAALVLLLLTGTTALSVARRRSFPRPAR